VLWAFFFVLAMTGLLCGSLSNPAWAAERRTKDKVKTAQTTDQSGSVTINGVPGGQAGTDNDIPRAAVP
jgi:hypothetical protein